MFETYFSIKSLKNCDTYYCVIFVFTFSAITDLLGVIELIPAQSQAILAC